MLVMRVCVCLYVCVCVCMCVKVMMLEQLEAFIFPVFGPPKMLGHSWSRKNKTNQQINVFHEVFEKKESCCKNLDLVLKRMNRSYFAR